VTFSTQDGESYMLTDSLGNQCPVYFGSLGVSAPTDLAATYDLYAIVDVYGNADPVCQLLPVKLERKTPYGLGDLPTLVYEYDDPDVTMGYDAIVLWQGGNSNMYLYLKDETGYGMVYGPTGYEYAQGDVIPAGYGGRATEYSCQYELANPTGFQPSCNHVLIEPEEITLSRIDETTLGHYVIVRNVYIDMGNSLLRDEYGNEVSFNNTFNWIPPYDLTMPVDVIGIVGARRNGSECKYRLLPINIGVEPIPGFTCLDDFYANCNQNDIVNFEAPFIVIYQNGINLYVKDQCGSYGLIYGNVGQQFEPGDLIIGAASPRVYQGFYEAIPVGEWIKIGKTDPVPAELIPIEEISQSMIHWYVGFENARLFDSADGDTWIEDRTGQIMVYNKFNTTITYEYDACDLNGDKEVNISDLNALIDVILTGQRPELPSGDPEGYDYYVDGFVSIYREQLELFPINIVHYGWPQSIWGDSNLDNEVNIADINCIIDVIIGQ